jgi:hypothetical protein
MTAFDPLRTFAPYGSRVTGLPIVQLSPTVALVLRGASRG